MPHSTARYAFEFALFAWAQSFRGGDGFLAVFGPAGAIAEVYVAEAAQSGKRLVSHELKDRVTQEHASWMYYDPFDLPEYAWLEWNQVPRATLEQLLDEQVVKVLSTSVAGPKELPESWGVMF